MSMKDLINTIDSLRDRLIAQCKESPEGADISARSISASEGYGPYLVDLSIERVEEDGASMSAESTFEHFGYSTREMAKEIERLQTQLLDAKRREEGVVAEVDGLKLVLAIKNGAIEQFKRERDGALSRENLLESEITCIADAVGFDADFEPFDPDTPRLSSFIRAKQLDPATAKLHTLEAAVRAVRGCGVARVSRRSMLVRLYALVSEDS